MPLNRREFITTALAGASGLTLGSLGLPRVIDTKRFGRPGKWGLSDERVETSVCGGCPAACSVKLRIVGDNVVGIRGNPLCPIARGGLCARGVCQIEALYDPDRLLGPMRRSDRSKPESWERVSWDDAMQGLTDQLLELGRAGRLHRVGVVLPPGGGAVPAIAQRLLASMGSPHLYRSAGLRDPAAVPAANMSMGLDGPWCYDLTHSNLVMSFGTPLLEGWLSPAWTSRVYGEGRDRKATGLQLIHVSSRFSETASHADRWVAVKPGTEAVLALGMASVLMRENRADLAFLKRWTAGFDAWTDADGAEHASLASLLQYNYQPRVVAAATGVPVPVIIELARAFAAAERPLAIGERLGVSAGAFGLMAVNSLNILMGRVMTQGGLLPPRAAPLSPLPDWKPGDVVRNRAAQHSLVGADATPVVGSELWPVLGERGGPNGEPPFDVLILLDGSVLSGLTPTAAAALTRVPTIVSLATGLDASTELADLVLPSPTTFEQVNEVEPPAFDGRSYVVVSQAAIAPLLDTRPAGDVLLELAKRLGGDSASALPFETTQDVITHRLAGLKKARRGTEYSSRFHVDWTRQMEEAGLWSASYGPDEDLVELVFARGGWVDPVVHYGNPASAVAFADHRVQFHSRTARERARELTLAFPVEDGDDAWLPHAEAVPLQAIPKDHLLLLPFAPRSFAGQGTPNLPSLFEQAGPARGGTFTPWVELSPDDAARLGIKQGQRVRVSSPQGSVELPTHIQCGIAVGVVAMPLMLAQQGQGQWARTWTAGAETLLADASAGLVGSRLATGVAVRVETLSGSES